MSCDSFTSDIFTMSFYVQLFLVASVLVVSTVSDENDGCSYGWKAWKGYCYNIHGPELDHEASWVKCRDDFHGDLAEITSTEENEFVKSWLAEEVPSIIEGVWIAPASYIRKHWMNMNNHNRIEFFDWAAEQPNDETYVCAYMSAADDYQWAAKRCNKSSRMSYLCKKDREGWEDEDEYDEGIQGK